MRVVTIDNGNTNPSVAFFSNGVLTQVIPLSEYIVEKNDFILSSNVGKKYSIKASFDLKTKRSKTHFFEMPVHYSESLGDDRLIAAYGIYKKFKPSQNQKYLIIDAGTFMTCDLVTDEGFKGGYIFPGLSQFLKTYGNSAQLPVLLKNDLIQLNNEIPQETNEAILKACLIYIQSTLRNIIESYQPTKLIFTGGDGELVSKLLNSSVPFEIDRHLVHLALSLIYQTQLSQD